MKNGEIETRFRVTPSEVETLSAGFDEFIRLSLAGWVTRGPALNLLRTPSCPPRPTWRLIVARGLPATKIGRRQAVASARYVKRQQHADDHHNRNEQRCHPMANVTPAMRP